MILAVILAFAISPLSCWRKSRQLASTRYRLKQKIVEAKGRGEAVWITIK